MADISVTVDPARNNGRVSLTRTMVPLTALIGPILAGDTPEAVQADHGLTDVETKVLAALARDIRDLTEASDA